MSCGTKHSIQRGPDTRVVINHQNPLPLTMLLQSLLYLCQNRVSGVRLGQEGNVQGGMPMPSQNLRRMRRHVENPLLGRLLQHVPADGDTVTLGHDYIKHEQIHTTVSLAQCVEGLGTCCGLEDPESLLTEDPVCDPARDGLVIHDQNGDGGVG